MKAAIVYASVHHGNTKKLVDAIAEKYNVTLIDATKTKEQDMSSFDLIGFASGIYFSKYHQSVMNFASINMPQEKDMILLPVRNIQPLVDIMVSDFMKGRHCSLLSRIS